MTKKLNSNVPMENVSPNYGNAILTMIVEMTRMNPLISAEIKIVRSDGNDVQDTPITDVFQNGFIVTEKTIVETDLMNYRKIVRLARKKVTTGAKIGDAFQSK